MNNIIKKIRSFFDKFVAEYVYNGKFVAFVTVICIVVMTAVFTQFFYVSTQSVRNKAVEATQQSLKQVEINICAMMEQAENVSNMIFNNSSVQTYLQDEHSDKDDIGKRHAEYAEYETLNAFLSNINSNNNDIVEIRLFVNNSKQYAHEHYRFFSEDDFKREPWYDTAVDAKGKVRWTSVYNEGSMTISCVRVIESLSAYDKVIGALAVDLPAKRLTRILSDASVFGENNTYLIDKNGRVIAAPKTDEVGTALLNSDMTQINQNSAGSEKYEVNGVKNCVIYQEVEGTDWKLAAVVPWTDISSYRTVMYSMSMITIIAFIVIFLTVLIAANLFSYSMRKKIKELAVWIEKENVENLENNIHNGSYDIQRLQNGIEDMLLQINNTMREYHKAKDKEREAHMKALQAQINPHFLYNVLDAVNWMAVKIGADDICFMVENLAEYFRLSLNKGKNIVTVADEIELSKIYLAIQNRRFSDCVTTIYDIDNEVYDYLIPKISLQPIIENALIHGIKEKKNHTGHIVIEGKKENGYLIIKISDDGIGMTEEQLKNCMKLIPDTQKSYTKNGYGLYNVDERIKLFSKDDNCGLSMKSVYGKGTEVTIKAAAKKQPSETED